MLMIRYRDSLALLYPVFGDAGAGISSSPVFLCPFALSVSGRKDKHMTNLPFERKSRVNTNSDNYLDSNGNYAFLAQKDADEGDPFDRIAIQMFDDEASPHPDIEKVLAFIETLTPAQQDLLYAHLGEKKFLEDIRREEEAATGKKITKQAMHNRWNKIITKACKYFGVEKPKQAHKHGG